MEFQVKRGVRLGEFEFGIHFELLDRRREGLHRVSHGLPSPPVIGHALSSKKDDAGFPDLW